MIFEEARGRLHTVNHEPAIVRRGQWAADQMKRDADARFLKYYTLFGFFVVGVVTVLLGQILPILSARLGLNDAQAGTFFLAQFSGSILGTMLSQRIARRFGFTFAAVIGLLLIAAGLPGINAGEFAICWAGVFVYGSGLGVTIPSINLLTIETSEPHLRSSAVNLINFSWGIGAICSQPFVAAVSRGGSLAAVTAILISVMLLLAVVLGSAVRKSARPIVRGPEAPPPAADRIFRHPRSWLFVAFSFFVVGIEGGLGGWLTTYTEVLRLRGVEIVNLTVIYFSFFVLGRGVASIVSRRVADNTLIFVCSAILLAGVVVIVSGESLAVVGAAIAGLGSSAIFPTNMVRFTRIFGESATLQAAPIFIAGTAGAAIVSSLVGFISSTFGDLRTGIAVVLASAAAVAVFHVAIVIVFRPERSS